MPVSVTHPRQTLIRPDAPSTPPKIEPALPNIVQWAARLNPKPQMQFAPSASAPNIRRRAAADVAAPEVANLEKNSGPLNIASAPMVNPQPQMPMARCPLGRSGTPCTHERESGRTRKWAVQRRRESSQRDRSFGFAGSAGARNERAGRKFGGTRGDFARRHAAGFAEWDWHGQDRVRRTGGGGSGTGISGGGGSNSLPASVSVSRWKWACGFGGGIGTGQSRSKLLLKPAGSLPDRPEPMVPRKGPANVADLGPNEAPEKILSGKEVYTLNVNLPNLTSVSGQLDFEFRAAG